MTARKPRRKITARPEEQLQRSVKQFLDIALCEGAVYHASPNGGGRSKAEGGVLKAMGCRAGWPDIEIVHAGAVAFIELKAPKGRLSAAQCDVHMQLSRAGCYVAVCRSLPEVEGTLNAWGIPLVASVLPSGAVQKEIAE